MRSTQHVWCNVHVTCSVTRAAYCSSVHHATFDMARTAELWTVGSTAYIVEAYIVMAYLAMAYIVMAPLSLDCRIRGLGISNIPESRWCRSHHHLCMLYASPYKL